MSFAKANQIPRVAVYVASDVNHSGRILAPRDRRRNRMIYGRISNNKREELYNKVWKTPVRQLAKEEGISDVALRKRLTKFDIPLPPRGYWAKSEEKRQRIPIPPLPEITRTLSERVFGYAIKRVDVDTLSDEQLASGSPLLLITEESKQAIKDFCENFSVENQLRKPTPWIQNLIDRIGEKREEEREALERHRYNIWYTPRKERTTPFDVSKKLEKRVLRMLDSLDKQLYEIEGEISDEGENWYENGRSEWSLILEVPSGRFNLSIQDNGEEKLSLSFLKKRGGQSLFTCKDGKDKKVEEQLGEALFELCLIADKDRSKYELKERQANRQYEISSWKRQMAETNKTEEEYRSTLLKLADNHTEAKRCRAFMASIEAVATDTEDANDVTLLKELKAWIKEYADKIDPFVRKQGNLGINDVWKLSELIQVNRARRQKLLDNEPHYSNDELGM